MVCHSVVNCAVSPCCHAVCRVCVPTSDNHARKLSLHRPIYQAGNGQAGDDPKRDKFCLAVPLSIAAEIGLHRVGVFFYVGLHGADGSSCACFNTTSPRLIRASPSRISIDENALIDIPLCLLYAVSSACSRLSRYTPIIFCLVLAIIFR